MSEKRLTRMTLAEALAQPSQTDWAKVDASDPYDVDPEDEFDWANAVVVQRPGKRAVSIRLDDDVLDHFRAGGPGYQTRINAVLRAYVDAQRKRAG